MIRKPYVGQRVKLSRHGFASLKLDNPEAFEDAKDMVVTYAKFIGDKSLGEMGNVWDVRVNKPRIDMYMLSILDLDEI